MKSIIRLYRNSFEGLSRPAWMLALVMLINRSGSMVLPFLSVYLTTYLGFSITQAGHALAMYGLGSIIGGFTGGHLTDRIGHFKVQTFSLIGGGIMFGMLMFVSGYYTMLIAIFLASMIIECLRPANSSSIALYAKPENLTRAFSLNRLAINLGFSLGPAIGGVLAAISFKILFLVDGVTCIAAGLVFYFYFKNRPVNRIKEKVPAETASLQQEGSPWRDGIFLLFVLCIILYGSMFFQLFTTLPLYYRENYQLSESGIGALLALNGIIVLVFEMILVYMIGNRYRYWLLIAAGTLLTGIAFASLNIFHSYLILIISMVILSFSEILAMPFIATLVAERASDSHRGAYMGLFTVSYSVALTVGPFAGTNFINSFGFDNFWWLILATSVITALGFAFVAMKMRPQLSS